MSCKLYTLNEQFIKETDNVLDIDDFTGIVRYESGTVSWHKNGKFHRIDGAALEYYDGLKYWYLNGILHRESGPAIEFPSGTKRWYFGDSLHRMDGPASEDSNGDKKWFLFGKECTEQQHKLLVDILKLKKYIK